MRATGSQKASPEDDGRVELYREERKTLPKILFYIKLSSSWRFHDVKHKNVFRTNFSDIVGL